MMKAIRTAILGLLAGVFAAAAAPTPEQLQAAAADPARIVDVIKECDSDTETAESVIKVIMMVDGSQAAAELRRENVALVVAHMVIWTGSRAPALLGLMAERMNLPLLPVLTAAAVLSSGAASPRALDAVVMAVEANKDATKSVLDAGRDPVKVLGAATADKISKMPIPVIPLTPVPTTSITILPVAKPVLGRRPSGGEPPPPPPPPPYNGQ